MTASSRCPRSNNAGAMGGLRTMWLIRITLICLVLTAGCSGREEPVGPGRFSVSAIRKTTAPNDGPATQLFLCENPLQAGEATTPYVSVYICKAASDLSGQRVRVTEGGSRFDTA